jgi:hypothetical protein
MPKPSQHSLQGGVKLGRWKYSAPARLIEEVDEDDKP